MVEFPIDIDKLLADEEMRKKMNEWNRETAKRRLESMKNLSEPHRRYLEKIASGEWKIW